MIPRLAKVSEIAERFRVSADAVYLWIRQGKIPPECVARIAGTVRVDEEEFERRLRSGSLCQPRGRKRTTPIEPETGKVVVSTMAADSFTTVGADPPPSTSGSVKRGKVKDEHPYSPEMVAGVK